MHPIHRPKRSLAAALTLGAMLLLVAGTAAFAQDLDVSFDYESCFTVTFNDENDGEWTFGNSYDRILHTGGNPGDYLNNDYLDTIGPHARTGWGVDRTFLGNYREMGVVGLSADLLLNHDDSTALQRAVTLILHYTNRTPDDYSDDLGVYNKGRMFNTQNWTTYTYEVPSCSEELPNGWDVWWGSELDEDEIWNIVIQNVDRVGFFVADPEYFYIFQMWDIGLDNPTIFFGEEDEEEDPGHNGPGHDDVELSAAPNPFNPRTELSFRLPAAASGSLHVFDLRGQRVAVLHEGSLSAGDNHFVWNGVDTAGRSLPSGVYFARLSVGPQCYTQKLLLNR